MYYTIYKTTNKVNGKFYIGTHKTRNLDDNYHGSGKYLKRAIEKHGIENFTKEILFVFDNPEEMFAKEAEIVNEDFLAEENTYNLKLGGSGGFDHLNHSDYANPSHSIDHMKMMNTARNCKLTADERSRISAIANKVRRKRMDENGGAWWSSPGFSGRTHTDSTKKKNRSQQ